jgi:hypothetical protein
MEGPQQTYGRWAQQGGRGGGPDDLCPCRATNAAAAAAQAVEVPLKLAQTAAVMEIVHSALGVVRSPVMITGGGGVGWGRRGARARTAPLCP